MEITDYDAKGIKWDCINNALDEFHHIIGDEVYIEDELIFQRRHFLSSKLIETMTVPVGTKCVIKHKWFDEGSKSAYADVLTLNGVRLYGVPLWCLNYEELPLETLQ